MTETPFLAAPSLEEKTDVGEAALTEAVRHVDIIHTSLAGMTAIVVVLLAALARPVFGLPSVNNPIAFGIIAGVAFFGILVLYYLNYRVHKHVTDQARLTEVLVNSLGQGFLVFDRNGLCGPVYSQACLDLLQTVPAGKSVADVLRVPAEEREDFFSWLSVLFEPDHALSFEDVTRFLPQQFPHDHERRIKLVYRPIQREGAPLKGVVLIATDQTEEFAARVAAKRQQNFAEMICRIFKDRNQFQSTIAHLREFLSDASREGVTQQNSAPLLRQLHTLKAAVKQFNLVDLGEIVHSAENNLRDPALSGDEAFKACLAVEREKIAGALARVTEEVSGLIGSEYEWRGNVREIGEADLYAFARVLKEKSAPYEIVQAYAAAILAVPIRDCFHAFERELRELAGMMDKQVKPVRFIGSNPHVLALPLQEFLFSLTHICRNIVDHGLETPVTRMAREKDAAGQVTISANIVPALTEEQAAWLRIVISDDGNGIDPSRVRAKLAALDPEGEWRFETDQVVIQRIFSWGFSTSETITEISGRGVGMEAVEREVKRLGGTIRVDSVLYKGTNFEINLPYTLDISALLSKLVSDQA